MTSILRKSTKAKLFKPIPATLFAETFVPNKKNTTLLKRLRKDYFSGKIDVFYANFPWDDVMACIENAVDGKHCINHAPCPKCGTPSKNLNWIEFVSPDSTWKGLMGTAGYLSICPKCRIQVESICIIMN